MSKLAEWERWTGPWELWSGTWVRSYVDVHGIEWTHFGPEINGGKRKIKR